MTMAVEESERGKQSCNVAIMTAVAKFSLWPRTEKPKPYPPQDEALDVVDQFTTQVAYATGQYDDREARDSNLENLLRASVEREMGVQTFCQPSSI